MGGAVGVRRRWRMRVRGDGCNAAPAPWPVHLPGAPAFVPAPRTCPARRAAVAAAALVLGLFGLWWQWPRAPTQPPPHATLSLTPIPSSPEAPAQAPGRGKGQLVFKEFVAKQVGAHPA